METYAADWILPVTSDPIQNGAVVTDGGLILFVGARKAAAQGFPRAQWRELGKAAIMPGLVNVHTHLELTVMRGYLEDLAFREWIVRLTRTRAEHVSPEVLQSSALLGAAEAIRSGTTTIADTGNSRAPFDAMLRSGLGGVAYREVFGPDPAQARASLDELQHRIDDMRRDQNSRVRVGASPHAPYTVSSALFSRVADYASKESLDVCIHAAESRAEEDLLVSGSGEFASGLASRGISWQAPEMSTIRYLDGTGILHKGPLLVHCVNVDANDLRLAADRGCRIAHCPRSNAKLGHGIAPFPLIRQAGVRTGLGTDSPASNNSLDMLGEARFCALLHQASQQSVNTGSAADMLRLATLEGAIALGVQDRTGSLEPGKDADFIAISLAGGHLTPVHDPQTAIVFSSLASDVVLTVAGGRILWDGSRVSTLDESDLIERIASVALP